MFGLLTTETDELVPVEQDPEVQKAMAHQLVALKEQAEQETEERKLIRIIMNQDDATEDQREEARRRASVKKGTQHLWFLEAAEAARDEAKRAERALQDAVGPARARLTETGTAKIAALVKRMDEALRPVRQLALDIEAVRQAMSDGGARVEVHPFPSLLPGQLLDFQTGICREKGWI